jgi:hypothetical protein
MSLKTEVHSRPGIWNVKADPRLSNGKVRPRYVPSCRFVMVMLSEEYNSSVIMVEVSYVCHWYTPRPSFPNPFLDIEWLISCHTWSNSSTIPYITCYLLTWRPRIYPQMLNTRCPRETAVYIFIAVKAVDLIDAYPRVSPGLASSHWPGQGSILSSLPAESAQ